MTQPLMTNPDVLLSQTEWLHHLARQLVGSREAQEDLVQETYLQALSQPEREIAHPGAFLAKVMRRLAARSTSREVKRGTLEARSVRNLSQASTEDLVERITVQRDLVNALLSMSRGQRDVLILRFYEDMGPTEIAARLDIPLATAKSRQQRGLEMLREKLTNYYGNDRDFRLALAPLVALAHYGPKAGSATLFSYASLKIAAAFLIALSSWGLFQLLNEDSSDIRDLSNFGVVEEDSQPQIGRSPGYQLKQQEVAQVLPQAKNIIQVQDAKGKAIADVPIAITAQVLSKKTTIWRGKTRSSEGTIDISDGLAVVAKDNRCAIYRASFGFPIVGGLQAEIDPTEGLAEALVATLPPTGKLQINLFDQSGKPFTKETTVTFNGLAQPDDSSGYLSPYVAKSSEGQVTLPYVGLGLHLLVEFADPHGKRPPQTLKLQGPKTAKNTRVVSFTMADDYPTIEGRLVDKNDSPVVNATFRAAFADDEETDFRDFKAMRRMRQVRRPFMIETDNRGKFATTWPLPPSFHGKAELVIGEHVTKGGASVGRAARVALPQAIPNTNINVGTLKLKGGAHLIRGQVVDVDGKPIEGAYVTLTPLGNRRSLTSTRTTHSGSFAIEGSPEIRKVRVRVRCPGYARPTGLEFDLANKNHRIVLLRAGSLKGSIHLQSPTDAWGISIRTARQTETTFRGKTFSRRRRSRPMTVEDDAIRRDGSFTIDNLAPGLVDIEILVGGQVVKTIERLEVKAGKKAAPKALQGIQLEERSPIICIQLLDDEGNPMAGRTVGTTKTRKGRFSTQTSNTTARLDEEGSLYRAAPQNSTKTVDLAIPGWKAVSVKVVKPKTVVHLERGPKIEFELSDREKFQGKSIVVKLQRKLGRPSRELNRAVRITHRYTAVLVDGKATLFISAYGDFNLNVEVDGDKDANIKFAPSTLTVEKMEVQVKLKKIKSPQKK